MELPLYIVNAFADAPFTGNPAAVCPIDTWLDDALMQAIAAQNNLAETAFVVPIGPGAYHIRWFTPAVEVPLCGHATLAAAHVLRAFRSECASRLRFASKSGDLFVDCGASSYTLDFPSDPPRRAPLPDWFPACFGANPLEFHHAGYFLAVFDRQEIVAALEPDFRQLGKLPRTCVIATAPGKSHDFVSRFFAPSEGIDEDPVTGSAHCILTPYWSRRLKKARLSARQISSRGGELSCELSGDRALISGRALTYSVGAIHV